VVAFGPKTGQLIKLHLCKTPIRRILSDKYTNLSRFVTFRNLFLLLLLAVVVSLPLSKWVTSAAQILLAAAWLAEGRFDEKWRRLRMHPEIAVFTLLFFVPLVAMAWSENIPFGLADLKVKLPLFILPVVLGSVPPLNKNEMRVILGGFAAAVIIGAVMSLSIMLGIGPRAYTGDRESILFISHIRFALMVDMAVFLLAYHAIVPWTRRRFRLMILAAALFLAAYLFILKSLTGVGILAIGGLILGFRWGLRQKEMLARWFITVGLVTLPLLGAIYLSSQFAAFYTVRETGVPTDTHTVKGTPYVHDLTNPAMENGYHTYYYICLPELQEAWNSVSRFDYAGRDRKGQELKYTLIRYLTSKGLRKDAYGVSQLEPDDIRLIEDGFANCIYRHPGRFSVRLYQTIWEIDQFRHGGSPSGLSVVQRLEYLKTGWAIFRDHPWIGVGTGDTQAAFDQKYAELNTRLEPEWRLRAHNQFLTFMISYGLIGLALLLAAIILPVVVSRGKNRWFIMMFFLVAMLSMLNEDTLETQAGVAFFGVFYSLFLFADKGGERRH
jgi:hypothetical protein